MKQARSIVTAEEAENLAIQALVFIAGEHERLGRFLAVTGLEAQDIRAAAAEPNFLAGVLEHVGADERLLLAFAAHAGVDPADVARARAMLGGGTWERETA